MTSNRNYAFIGASGGHHDISHHNDNPDNIAKLKKIGKWELDQLSVLLTKLQSLPDSDGRTVLDNTLVFYSSDISDGDAHNHDDMPVLLAGGGAGFSMGRHVEFPEKPQFGQLFLSIANAYGSPITTFGGKRQGAARGSARLESCQPSVVSCQFERPTSAVATVSSKSHSNVTGFSLKHPPPKQGGCGLAG